MDLFNIIIEFLQHHTGVITLVELGAAFLLGTITRFPFLSRIRDITLFLQVTILIARMAQWYLKTHPYGKKHAKETDIDEKLNHLVDSKIKPEAEKRFLTISEEYPDLVAPRKI